MRMITLLSMLIICAITLLIKVNAIWYSSTIPPAGQQFLGKCGYEVPNVGDVLKLGKSEAILLNPPHTCLLDGGFCLNVVISGVKESYSCKKFTPVIEK